MPPAYWPSITSQVMIYESALKRATREDILFLLSLHRRQLEELFHGRRDALRDFIYNSRSAIASGWTPDGALLEIGLRLDGRAEHERCIVFHARYL